MTQDTVRHVYHQAITPKRLRATAGTGQRLERNISLMTSSVIHIELAAGLPRRKPLMSTSHDPLRRVAESTAHAADRAGIVFANPCTDQADTAGRVLPRTVVDTVPASGFGDEITAICGAQLFAVPQTLPCARRIELGPAAVVRIIALVGAGRKVGHVAWRDPQVGCARARCSASLC